MKIYVGGKRFDVEVVYLEQLLGVSNTGGKKGSGKGKKDCKKGLALENNNKNCLPNVTQKHRSVLKHLRAHERKGKAKTAHPFRR